jgi:hypothetical protein
MFHFCHIVHHATYYYYRRYKRMLGKKLCTLSLLEALKTLLKELLGSIHLKTGPY